MDNCLFQNIIDWGVEKLAPYNVFGAKSYHHYLVEIVFRTFVAEADFPDLSFLYDCGEGKKGRKPCDIGIIVAMMIYMYGCGHTVKEFAKRLYTSLCIKFAIGCPPGEEPPCIATVYNFMGKVQTYTKKMEGKDGYVDVFALIFKSIVMRMCKILGIKGNCLRTDSKLFWSNIADNPRFVIVVQVLELEWRKGGLEGLILCRDGSLHREVKDIVESKPRQEVYRNESEAIEERLLHIGNVIWKVLGICKEGEMAILRRLFNDQFLVGEDGKVQLRDKHTIKADSIQSAYDTTAQYREKHSKVKGYVVNIAETIGEYISLVTSVIMDTCGVSDTIFTMPCIEENEAVTGSHTDSLHADGAYQNVDIRDQLEDRDTKYTFTGFVGRASRYKIVRLKDGGVEITDTETGVVQAAHVTKKGSFRIDNLGDGKTKYLYFSAKRIKTAEARASYGLLTEEDKKKRNNVEATIAQFSAVLDGEKCRYRGMFACRRFCYCRAIWMNVRRICIYIEKMLKKGSIRWCA